MNTLKQMHWLSHFLNTACEHALCMMHSKGMLHDHLGVTLVVALDTRFAFHMLKLPHHSSF